MLVSLRTAVADWAEVEDIWTERVDRQKYPKM